MRLEEFITGPQKTGQPVRLENFISGKVMPAVREGIKESITLPMQRPDKFVRNPTVKAVDNLAGNLLLGMPVSSAVTNAYNNVQKPGDILSRSLSPKEIALMGMTVPSFKHTEDALSYGKTIKNNLEKIKELIDKRSALEAEFNTMPRNTKQDVQNMVNKATEMQLVREAYEEALSK